VSVEMEEVVFRNGLVCEGSYGALSFLVLEDYCNQRKRLCFVYIYNLELQTFGASCLLVLSSSSTLTELDNAPEPRFTYATMWLDKARRHPSAGASSCKFVLS
jgi:hypothetical protein